MANPLRRLLGETALYGVSSVLGRVLNFLLVPLYTEYLPSGDYGIVTDLYAWVAFFLIVYTYGMETAYFRHATKHPTEADRYFRGSTTSILLTTLVLSGTIACLATPITNFLQYPGKEHFIYWLVIILAVDAIAAVPFARLRLQHKAKSFAAIKLLGTAITIGLNLFFILLCPRLVAGNTLPWVTAIVEAVYTPTWSVEYVFVSNLIANSIMLLLLLPHLKDFRLELRAKYLRPMLVYAYPLLFMGMAGSINEMMSRAFLKQLMPEGFYPGRSNQDALGIFGASYKLAIFMNLAVQAFRYAAEPFFFSRASDKNSPKLFAQVMHGFILLGVIMLLGITANLSWVAPLLLRKAEYLEALEIVPILLIANLFLGIYFNLSVWFKLTDQTHFGTWIAVGGAILTITLNILLIPSLGYMGAAITTAAVYFLMTIANFKLGQKHYPIPYHTTRGIFYLGFASVVALLIQQFSNQMGQGLTLLIGNGALLILLFFIVTRERKYFHRIA